MVISLKCFAQLGVYLPENAEAYALEPGDTVAAVMERLGLPQAEVKLVFVNGLKAGFDTVLRDGDRLGLFPAVGGG